MPKWQTTFFDEEKWIRSLPSMKPPSSTFSFITCTRFHLFPFLEEITPKDQQREHTPFIQFVLVFLMRIIGSIPKMEQVHELLLTDELLMGICGFNGYQIRNGSCARGIRLRTTPLPEIRGAICVDTLAKQIVKTTPRTIENFFNRAIGQLVRANIFPKYIHAACDATDLETTKQFKGCGAVTRERKVKAKGRRQNGELKAVKVTIHGWKVWAIYELNTGIPLAIKIDTIEKPDNLHVLAVLEQAKENIGPQSTIRSLVVDRGFLDGKVLFAIDQKGIEFVIPLKRNMEAAIDARQLALEAEGSYHATRDADVTHGYGKAKYTETIRTELVGVPGLLICDWFNPEGSKTNTARKDYIPLPLNAVVVKTWDNLTPPLDKQVVLVTNGNVQDPFIAFDRYDDRSHIENNLFRDTKQNCCLEHPPKKTKEGVLVQVYIVMAVKALTTAFLMCKEEQARLHEAGEQTSWNRYRRKLKAINRNKLIVFVGTLFGTFFSHEVFMLAGVSVHDAQKELKITRAQIYAHYTGLNPPDSS